MRILILEVEGIGCKGCVLPIKTHLFKVKGVNRVHVVGRKVVVIYDDKRVSREELLSLSRVRNHYNIKILVDRDVDNYDQVRRLYYEYIYTSSSQE